MLRALPRPRAFSLIELVLALSLLTLLAGAMTLRMAGVGRSAEFDEGLERLHTSLRLLRAESVARGRRFRLSVHETAPQLVVEWEADPTGRPGQFSPCPVITWAGELPNGLLRVLQAELTGPSAYAATPATRFEGAAEPSPAAVTFYPDGSCDFARFVVAAAEPHDPRQAQVELNGLTGIVRITMLDEEQRLEQP